MAGVTVLVWCQQSIISKPLLYSSRKLSGPNTSEGKQKDKLMNPYMWNVKTLLLNSCLDNTHGHKNKQMNLLKLWNHKKKSDVCYSVFWGFGCTLHHHRNKWHFICFSFTAFCLQCLGVISPPLHLQLHFKMKCKTHCQNKLAQSGDKATMSELYCSRAVRV